MPTNNLTQITAAVITSNNILERHVANANIITRHIADANVTQAKLAEDANVALVQSNLTSVNNQAHANDFATYSRLNANVNLVQSNLTALIGGSTQFTAAKIFQQQVTMQGDLIVQGDLFIEGDTFTANVGTLQIEDSNIVLNHGGTNTSADLAGIQIEGTGAALLANIYYSSASLSNFRIGWGTLTSADDIARTQDYQANDYSTFTTLDANTYDTYVSLNANINTVSGNVTTLSNNTLPLAGGTMTGFIVLHAAPSLDLHASTKKYVDDSIGVTRVPLVNTNSSSGTSNVFFLGTANVLPATDFITIWVDGVYQPEAEWIYNSGNGTVQFTDASIPSGLVVDTRILDTN